MLKLFCCLFVIFIGGYLGFEKSRRYQARVRQLEKCELLLVRLKTYLSATHMPTGELFARLAQTDSLSELTFLKAAGDGLKDERNFPKVWQESLQSAKPALALKNEDYTPLVSLSELIGSYDTDGLLNGIELSCQLLKQAQGEALLQSQTNGRLARSLGVLAGVAVAILLL